MFYLLQTIYYTSVTFNFFKQQEKIGKMYEKYHYFDELVESFDGSLFLTINDTKNGNI